MKNLFKSLIFALFAFASSASFASVCAPFYGNIQQPGVYFGSGNVNGKWTSCWNYDDDPAVAVELAFRVKNRQTGELINADYGTYTVSPGLYSGGGVKAKWNWEWSINEGSSTGLTYQLGIDHNPNIGYTDPNTIVWVNPLTYWADNAIAPIGFRGAQNSENVGFGDTPGGAFDVTKPGDYTFFLQAWDATRMVNHVEINVVVDDGSTTPHLVPEPGTTWLLFAGLGMMGFTVLRRSKKQSQ